MATKFFNEEEKLNMELKFLRTWTAEDEWLDVVDSLATFLLAVNGSVQNFCDENAIEGSNCNDEKIDYYRKKQEAFRKREVWYQKKILDLQMENSDLKDRVAELTQMMLLSDREEVMEEDESGVDSDDEDNKN